MEYRQRSESVTAELVLDTRAQLPTGALQWLPGLAPVAAAGAGQGTVTLGAGALRLTATLSCSETVLTVRGELCGLTPPQPLPVPAECAMTRDYLAGGLTLADVSFELPAADAYQRPRWTVGAQTLELLTLDPRVGLVRQKTAAGTVSVKLYPSHTHAGRLPFAFALVLGATARIVATCDELLAAEGVPGAHTAEARARLRALAPFPTAFALNTTARTAPALLAWAREAGFRSLLLHAPTWAATDGHYAPNLTNWPGGWPELRAFVAQARAAGIAVGLHTLTTSIANTDPYVTPVPDPRLLTVWRGTLATDLPADSTTVALAETPAGFSPRDDYMSFGRTVRIGDELIRYGKVAVAERTLLACERGAYGTRAAAHSAGTQVHYLYRCFGEFTVDTENSLADEVAASLAHAFRETGAEMIYFDDSEAMPEPYQAHVSAFHAKVWRAIGMPHLHVQASSTGFYGTHLLTRVGQQDTVIYKQALLDHVILPRAGQYLAAGLVPDFGWFGLVFGDLDKDTTSNDDLDALMARVLGCGAGVTVFAMPEHTGTPLFARAARRLALWRRAAEGPAHDAAARPQDLRHLATAGREFRVLATATGGVQLRESRPWRGRAVADASGNVELRIPHSGPAQPLALHGIMRPPAGPVGSAQNLVLWPQRGARFAVVDGAACGAVHKAGTAVLRWHSKEKPEPVSDAVSFEPWPVAAGGAPARWRLVFPQPLDVSQHRALYLRLRWDGEVTKAGVALVTGLSGWVTGKEFALQPQVTEQLDPTPAPATRFTGRWPGAWYSYFMGVAYPAIEALEINLSGVSDRGALVVERIEALRETRLPGEWSLSLAAGGFSCTLGRGLAWDGAFELAPAGDTVHAELEEMNGSLRWAWGYAAAGFPRLQPGENIIRLSGLPPAARLDLRVDRLTD